MKNQLELSEILPEEIWFKVVEKLDDPNDLQSMNNSSNFFRKAFSTKQVVFLFSKVWDVLQVYYHKEYKKNQNYHAEQNPGIVCQCGRVRRPTQFSSILTLRLVCREWSESLDVFYTNREHTRQMILSHDESENPIESICATCVDNRFLRHFETTHDTGNTSRNPVIGRNLSLHLTSSPYNINKLRVVSKYGNHIWYCSIKFELVLRGNYLDCYNTLSELLNFMPNLKVLKINFHETTWLTVGQNRFRPARRQIPVIGNMQNLQYFWAKNAPAEIVNAVLSTNGHVSLLELDHHKNCNQPFIFPTPMENLRKLSIACSSKDMDALESPSVNWQLETLHIQFLKPDEIRWYRIFSLLENKWSNSITNLRLCHEGGVYDSNKKRLAQENASLRLRLPLMKRLKLVIGNYTSLDFTLPMRESLERLEVCILFNEHRWRRDEELKFVEEGQNIEFIGHANRMLHSNIWTLFPELKEVKFSYRFNPETGELVWKRDVAANTWSYTREQWEYTMGGSN